MNIAFERDFAAGDTIVARTYCAAAAAARGDQSPLRFTLRRVA
jgi:hypothetical protein